MVSGDVEADDLLHNKDIELTHFQESAGGIMMWDTLNLLSKSDSGSSSSLAR